MPGEDITFCTNQRCGRMDCRHNPQHIHRIIPHSFAVLEGDPRYCPRAALSNVGWPNNGKARKRRNPDGEQTKCASGKTGNTV